jgi:hypothetical protein
MAQAATHWPLTVKAWVRVWVSYVGFVVYKMAMGQVFLRVSPVNIIPLWLSIFVSSGGWTIGPLVDAV